MLVATKIHLWLRPTTADLSRNVFAHERADPPIGAVGPPALFG